VSAVLVGILAIAANAYIKFAPQLLNGRSDKASKIEVSSSHGIDSEVLDSIGSILPTPEKCLAELERFDDLSLKLVQSAKKSTTADEMALRKLEALGTQAEKLYQLIVLDPAATAGQKREARLATLALTFRAARLVTALQDSFWRISNEVVAQGDANTDAVRAAGLQILMRIDFESPDVPRLLSDLRQLVLRFPSTEVGVEVFILIANELAGRARTDIAKVVLKEGANLYEGASKSRLINEMIDLDRRDR
jgi:hypothetical protein